MMPTGRSSTRPGESRRSVAALAAVRAGLVRLTRPVKAHRVRLALMAALAASISLIGLADYLTGPLLSMELFYLLPVCIGTLVADARSGVALAVEAAVVSLIANPVLVPHHQHAWVAAANTVLMVVTLTITVGLISSLKDHVEVAERSEQRSREFLADAAHQLRTPIAGMLASTEALVMTEDHSARETLLTNLGREAHRSGRLLSSLLRITRLDQAEPMPTRPVDIVALCRVEIDRISSLAPHLQCRVDVADTIATSDGLSPDATREALANLVDNSRRHARNSVTLQVRVADGQLRLAVQDDGPGLGPDMVDTAFERFVSLDGCGGSGLGLPIARAIAQKSGGSLSYADQQFVLSLPYRPVPAAH